jgi:hypothetical protein
VPLPAKQSCAEDDEILLIYSGGDSRLCAAAATVSELAQMVWEANGA